MSSESYSRTKFWNTLSTDILKNLRRSHSKSVVFSLCMDLKIFYLISSFSKNYIKNTLSYLSKTNYKRFNIFCYLYTEMSWKNSLDLVLHFKTEFINLVGSHRPLKYAAVKIQGPYMKSNQQIRHSRATS